MQALIPTTAEYAPAGQFVQTFSVLPLVTSEDFPAEHPVQALIPTTAEYAPAEHPVQALIPTTAEYVPDGQVVQTLSLLALVTPEYFPTEHPVQALAPTTAEYDPAGQAMQFPRVPYDPTGQPELTHALEPAIDVVSAAHAWQVSPAFEYVLSGHWRHCGEGVPHLLLHSQHCGHAPSLTQ